MRYAWAFAAAIWVVSMATTAAELPMGLAAKYPGDEGLARDPAVLFSDDFEAGDLKKWDEVKRPVNWSRDNPHAGSGCVELPMNRGKDTGGHLVKWFMPGAEKVYVRFYVKFSDDFQYSHHFVHVMAAPAREKWKPFGKAGIKPDGTYFTVGMEPWFAWGENPPPGEVSFYAYWPDMEIDRKMNKYWGNSFFPPGPGRGKAAGPNRVIPPLGKWQCWEMLIEENTAPDQADGRQAMWIDGKPVGEFGGMRWRTDMNLKINILWLMNYGYDDGDPTKKYWKDKQTVVFDDVVVAKQYIGPRQAR